MELTISGEDKGQLKKVEDLARKMGLCIRKSKSNPSVNESEERQQKLFELMQEMAASSAFKSIEDPVAWQREQRKDRPLPGREEK